MLPVPDARVGEDGVVVVALMALAHQQAREVLEHVLTVGGVDGTFDRFGIRPYIVVDMCVGSDVGWLPVTTTTPSFLVGVMVASFKDDVGICHAARKQRYGEQFGGLFLLVKACW